MDSSCYCRTTCSNGPVKSYCNFQLAAAVGSSQMTSRIPIHVSHHTAFVWDVDRALQYHQLVVFTPSRKKTHDDQQTSPLSAQNTASAACSPERSPISRSRTHSLVCP
jgi:hypothetical protein